MGITDSRPLFLGALFVGATLLGSYGVEAQESLTVVSWGGAYTRSQVEAYHKPFTKKTGIAITSEDYNGGLAQIKAQVESGNVTWDVVDLETSDAIRGCDDGLLERIDASVLPPAPDGTPAEEDFIPGTLLDCAVGEVVWSTVVAFDPHQVSQGQSAESTEGFLQRRAIPGQAGSAQEPACERRVGIDLRWCPCRSGLRSAGRPGRHRSGLSRTRPDQAACGVVGNRRPAAATARRW